MLHTFGGPIAGEGGGRRRRKVCSVRLVWFVKMNALVGVLPTFGIVAVCSVKGQKAEDEDKRHECLQERHFVEFGLVCSLRVVGV